MKHNLSAYSRSGKGGGNGISVFVVVVTWFISSLSLFVEAFTPLHHHGPNHVCVVAGGGGCHGAKCSTSKLILPKLCPILLRAVPADDDDDDERKDEKEENPYQDPNYPDLEFVNYSDPEYQVDQGVGDEFFDPSSTEAQIEEMREDRRRRNDEFQFETYYKEVLKDGAEYKGEWTVYQTSTFFDDVEDDPSGFPRLMEAAKPLRVITRGERVQVDPSSSSDKIKSTARLDNERILHLEKISVESSNDDADEKKNQKSPEQLKQEEDSMNTKYWPEQLSANDFRGQQGIMCVGNGYTICTAVKLFNDDDDNDDSPSYEGPFSEYRAELGIQSEELRFRIKLDYSILESTEQANMSPPPLHLKTMTVCRETLGMWPRSENYRSAIQAKTDVALFGPPGAPGGLYDPPPVGSEEQANQYLMLDLEGGATLLLPYLMDQDESVHPNSGWVTSLDWTPGRIRYQVDRKVNGGKDLLGLRTLELSEVQGADADAYRPRDGGQNMRQ